MPALDTSLLAAFTRITQDTRLLRLTTALGEFGRGDVQISVEAPSNTITARRYATLANGSVTQLNSGTVAADQNQVNVP